MCTANSSDSAPLPDCALIAGPTASGKSDLAVRLALALKARGREGVVINADSAQVYGDLAVLSARPTEQEMHGIEHRLFGTWDGARPCSAADWAKAARAEVQEAQARGAVPILVGGTGLYLRTLLDGIAPIPPIDPAVREAVRCADVADNYAALLREDPDRAARLSPNDTTRVARALEVIRSSGQSLSQWQARLEGGIGDAITLHAAVLLPPRDWLYERCDRRFSLMLAQGALGEVEALLARSLDPALPVMRAIGVPELQAYLAGEETLAVAENRAQQATRNYAKRQLTWFRNQPPAGWSRVTSKDYDLDIHFASLLRD